MFDQPFTYATGKDALVITLAYPEAGFDTPMSDLGSQMGNSFVMGLGRKDRRWWGCETGTEARRRMTHGWDEGMDLLHGVLGQIGLPELPKRRRTRWGLDGEPDTERVLFLDPEPFREKAKALAPLVKITVDVGGNCNVSADELKWSGGVAVSLSEQLELAGFNTEIIAMEAAIGKFNPGPRISYTLLRLKAADEPANFPVLVGNLFTTAAFRVAMWRSWFNVPYMPTWGLGSHYSIPEEMRGDIHVGDNVRSLEGARKFLDELPSLKRQDLKNYLTRR